MRRSGALRAGLRRSLRSPHSTTVTTWDEYVALTDPTSSESAFAITAVTRSTNEVHVTIVCSAERVYDLLSRTNLFVTEWIPVPGFSNVGGDASGAITFDLPGADGKVFYRARVRIP